jgi:dethiobiotin synthetase
MNNTFFVTGTDTGIGKTFVTCILMQFIKFHHKKVIGMKPIAAGIDIKNGVTSNEDVNLLKYESTLQLEVDEINTYSFDEPMAPHIAAQKHNIEIDFKKIKMHAETLKNRADYLLIEGAGGYLVPLGESTSIADLVEELNIPIIVVIGIKLGCINHSLLTVEAILKRGQKIFGWVANILDNNMLEVNANISSLRQRIEQPLIGTIPYSPDQKPENLKNYITWPNDL